MDIDNLIDNLIENFSDTKSHKEQAIFSSLFIISNRLQTLFDNHISDMTLKQFMLLSIVRNSKELLTFTQLGDLLGCSRQNAKKLSTSLEEKGFVKIIKNPSDARAFCPKSTEKTDEYWNDKFIKYQHELSYLFEVYSDDEIATLFELFMKLYPGINNLEEKISNEKK